MAIRIDATTDSYSDGHTSTTYTMLCWAYLSVDRNDFSTIFEPASSQSSYVQVGTGADGVTLGAFIGGGDLAGVAMTVGNWYRVALVSNANSLTFYSAAATGSFTVNSGAGPPSFAPTTLRIGHSVFTGEFFNGRIAAYKQWSVALSAAQIEAEFDTYMPRHVSGLTRWYPWLVAETVDYSGAGNTLTGGGTTPATEDGPSIRWSRSRGPRVGSSVPAQTVTLTGIASAEAWGSPTLTVGPVIQPTGIASAEAWGSPTFTSGPVTVTLTGITSAEAFGTPTLRPSISLASIASAEAFGVARLDLNVTDVGGIATAEAWGATILQYVQTVTLASIPTSEVWGTPELGITIDTSSRVLTARLQIVPKYELLAYARIPAQTGSPQLVLVDPLDWASLRWSSTLSKPQTLNASCRVSSIPESIKQRLRLPESLPTELVLQRNGRIVFSGPLMGATEDNESVSFEARGLMAYMDYWLIVADVRFVQQDQFVIVKTLVDNWQALDHANYGIVTASIGTSGVLRDVTYERKEIHQISRRIEELGASANGFDAEVDPATRELKLWYPTKGVDRSSGPSAIVFDGRSVDGRGGMFSVAPGDLASDAYGTGTAAGEETTFWSEQANLDQRSAWGRAATFQSWSEVNNQAELDAYVTALRDARDQALRAPGRQVRVTPDTDLDLYDVGDIISYEISGLLGIGGIFRIRSRTVNVEQSGQETVTLEFT